MKFGELQRLAFQWAISDRQSLLDAYANSNDAEVIRDTESDIAELRAYYSKRWGESKLSRLIREAKSVDVSEIQRIIQESRS